MKVAAWQAPLYATRSVETALGLIREQVERCEAEDVEILCCPEGVLGGLADYAARPAAIAIDVEAGELDARLAPLASDRVATIVGFTEAGRGGRLYNAAAVFHRGRSPASTASCIPPFAGRSTTRAARRRSSRSAG